MRFPESKYRICKVYRLWECIGHIFADVQDTIALWIDFVLTTDYWTRKLNFYRQGVICKAESHVSTVKNVHQIVPEIVGSEIDFTRINPPLNGCDLYAVERADNV